MTPGNLITWAGAIFIAACLIALAVAVLVGTVKAIRRPAKPAKVDGTHWPARETKTG